MTCPCFAVRTEQNPAHRGAPLCSHRQLVRVLSSLLGVVRCNPAYRVVDGKHRLHRLLSAATLLQQDVTMRELSARFIVFSVQDLIDAEALVRLCVYDMGQVGGPSFSQRAVRECRPSSPIAFSVAEA